ncbi:MAG: DUF3696 domain-containing protein [Acidobacteria bacterium]|nr:DUF3696 domain-containing protein [Acidobacteriota bacterium]
MITRLRAKNFKSWKDTSALRLAPLTGLFGTNSSGKTSIMQILLMLKQTAESADRKRTLNTGDDHSLVDLGTFFDLIHNHQVAEPLELSLSWNLPEKRLIDDPEKQGAILYEISQLSFTTLLRAEWNRAVVESFSYQFDETTLGMQRRNGQKDSDKDQYDLIHRGFNVRRIKGRAWPLPAPVRCYGFPDEAIGYYQNTGFLPDFALAFEDLMKSISYLGPLREYPERSYIWAGDSPENVGRNGELAIPALLASRDKRDISRGKGRGRKKQTVEECVAGWLKKMGMIESFSLQPIASNRKDYEVRVRKTSGSSEVLITDVGFGVSQILPVLVLCYYVPEGSIILLEQPEIHLHPFVQSALADVLIDTVKTRNVQVIVESHSEHLVRRLQRRIAEEVIPVNDVALYFCRIEDGVSRMDQLEVDSRGNIANWPKDFFGDEMGDLLAMTEAAMKRQGAMR